ncbi:glycosyltransferase family 4 protein [Aquirufa nivalisilvae]
MGNSKNQYSALFLGNWPPPFGGIASHLYELLPEMAEKGINVYSLSFHTNSDDIKKSEKGVINYFFNPLSYFKKRMWWILVQAFIQIKHKKDLSFKKYLRALSIADKVNIIVDENKLTHVFTYDNDQIHITPFLKSRFHQLKVYSTIYAGFYVNKHLYDTEKKFLTHAFTFPIKILSCSKYCVDSAKEYLGIEYKTTVLYNNVLEEIYYPGISGTKIRQMYGINSEAIVLMTMGRIGYEMGIDFLIEESENILNIDERIIIFFVGARGELSSQIEELASKHERIKFAFDISFEDKPEFFASCDIFTAPSKQNYPCMGIANIEAMMCGKVVLSSKTGGHLETIEDNVSGILVPFHENKLNAKIYLDELSKLVVSKELRQHYGFAARERGLRLFTNDNIVDQHIQLIQE